jgi:hypothetical protein
MLIFAEGKFLLIKKFGPTFHVNGKLYVKGDFLDFLCTVFNTASSVAPDAGIEPRIVASCDFGIDRQTL